jgi:NADH dehydrogenase/NADH:ubiquinone oxidoreductase subunit G
MAKLVIDEAEIEAEEGANLLKVCLDNDIYIPNLCWLESDDTPHASCRLCYVEVGGYKSPVPSCSIAVTDEMVVKTDTDPVRRLQKTGLRFLLSTHKIECKECHANKQCALQDIAKFLKVSLKPKGLEQRFHETDVDEGHPCFTYYPNRCVLCGKCIRVCRNEHGHSTLTFARRGIDTVVTYFKDDDAGDLICDDCGKCAEICPVGALAVK